jgi:DNA-binding LacI/PurR family transcriptional regulator
MKPNLQTIAEMAGVSTATVSRALNDRAGVNPQTRERVLRIAREMGYMPNMAAKGLATSRAYTLGLITYERKPQRPLSNFPDDLIQGADLEARERGYHVITTFVNQDMMQDPARIPLISEGRVDGLILVGPALEASFIIHLYTSSIPIVLVDNLLTETDIDAVVCDNVGGTYGITRHLIDEHGLRRLAFFSGPGHWFSSRERWQGYQQALDEIDQELCVHYMPDTTMQYGYEAMIDALDRYPDVEGIVAVNDATAFGAIRACKERGLRVPDDMAVVGFDNIAWAQFHDPPLTTVRMFKYETAIQAVRHLIDKIERDASPSFQLRLGTELIVRTSCGCPPTDANLFSEMEG